MVAVILHKMNVRSVFYENGTIKENDLDINPYYSVGDVGKDIISFMRIDMNMDTVHLSNSCFNGHDLDSDIDIIVNSDPSDWVNIDEFITINTWNYRHIHFENFKYLSYKADVPDISRMFIDNYILSIKSVDDMINCVVGGVVF